jgi:hypothetical protein
MNGKGAVSMVEVTGGRLEGKLNKRNYPLIAVIVSSVIMALLVLKMIVMVLVTQPL